MARQSLADLREEMRSLARVEREARPLTASPMLVVLSREALDLLGRVLPERPSTVSELVAQTGRAQPNVSRSLQQLASYGLIWLKRDCPETRPVPMTRELRVDLTARTCTALPPEPTGS